MIGIGRHIKKHGRAYAGGSIDHFKEGKGQLEVALTVTVSVMSTFSDVSFKHGVIIKMMMVFKILTTNVAPTHARSLPMFVLHRSASVVVRLGVIAGGQEYRVRTDVAGQVMSEQGTRVRPSLEQA